MSRFRWAVCQLDSLINCLTRSQLRKSLAALPATLDETYDRILLAIDNDHSEYALRILQWLAFSARPLRVDEIAEVVAIDVSGNRSFDPDQILEDPLDVLKICSSLVEALGSRRPWGCLGKNKNSFRHGPRESEALGVFGEEQK